MNATVDGEWSGRRAAHHRGPFRQCDHDAVGLRDGLGAVADQLQYFVKNEALRLEQVAIGSASRGQAPAFYLLVEVRKGEQRAQGFLARNRFEDAIALLQRGAGVRRCRRFPVNSSWIGTHAGAVRIKKNVASSYPGLAGRLIAALGSIGEPRRRRFLPGNDRHNSNFQPNSL